MFKLLQENIKYVIAGLSLCFCVSSMGSCDMSNAIQEKELGIIAIKKGYVQKEMNNTTGYIWINPNGHVNVSDDD